MTLFGTFVSYFCGMHFETLLFVHLAALHIESFSNSRRLPPLRLSMLLKPNSSGKVENIALVSNYLFFIYTYCYMLLQCSTNKSGMVLLEKLNKRT